MSFRPLVDALFADYFRLNPVHATTLGMHAHDGRWPDLSTDGHAAWRDWVTDAQARLAAVDASSLTADEAIDHDILTRAVAAWRFSAEGLRDETWSPLSYVYLFGTGLFDLLAREFAPLPDRLASAASRLRGLPAALDQARQTLLGGGPRPISRFHTEKAVERIGGVGQLVADVVNQADALGHAELLAEVRSAADAAITALEIFTSWLRDELLPTATGDFRLGPDLYAAKFRHNLQAEVSVEELEQRATTAFAQVRGEIIRLGRDLWPAWMGDEAMPPDGAAAARAVLDKISDDHPPAAEYLDFCREENARIEAFVRERDLLGLADEPLKIVWTPEFLRSFGGAMLLSPGPLDRGLDSFFAVTPVNEEWTPELQESYLREDNSRMLRLLTIHEAVPGHYLQLAYANRTPSLVRAALQSGTFAEGWAVYVTQVMMDVGYGADDPALMLVHWKFFLRSITNTMMDIGIHAGRMDREEAMRLMVDGGFQEEGEATAKWDRARLSSTQLCEYFHGYAAMTDLEAEARRRTAAEGRQFVYRPFLESVLAHGTPPLPVIRAILFG